MNVLNLLIGGCLPYDLHVFVKPRQKMKMTLITPVAVYLQCLVVSLQLPTEALQLAAGQDGLAVLPLQVDLLLHNLRLLLLQGLQPLLHAAALLQLNTTHSQYQTACKTKGVYYEEGVRSMG